MTCEELKQGTVTDSQRRVLQTLGNSTHITNGDIKSEAFLDPRAAMLFRVPGDVPGHVYFALPVVISSQTDLLSDLDCSSTKGFSGTLVWRLAFDYTARSGLGQTMTTQRLAAIPAWCGPCRSAHTNLLVLSHASYINRAMWCVHVASVRSVCRHGSGVIKCSAAGGAVASEATSSMTMWL